MQQFAVTDRAAARIAEIIAETKPVGEPALRVAVLAGGCSGFQYRFELDGQRFTALNGGPLFQFNESVSFVVRCDNQAEVDEYWNKLTADGGSESQCGWLKDKFGLSWQIVPSRMIDLIKKPAAMQAMLKMKKIDIAELERAAEAEALTIS